MADNKKPQYGTISGPPKKPNEPETETVAATPPGRKPPNVIGDTEFVVAPEAEPSATNPPGGTRTPIETETSSADEQPSTNVIRGVRYEVARQPTHLAQEIKPRKTREMAFEREEYSAVDQKNIDAWQRITDATTGKNKAVAADFLAEAKIQSKLDNEEKYGPVPEKDLPELTRMYAEFKNFYYQGYADAKQKTLQEVGNKINTEAMAAYAQEQQIYAMRYGMSSLVDLHQGLNIASWNFFFKTLGPLGMFMFGPVGALGMPLATVLEKIHSNELSFNMGYYGGRYWWSPNRVDYLIKTLPEEKAVDLVLDVSKKTLYLVSKISGVGIVSKAQAFDRYGRPKKGYVFTPLLKLQKGVVRAGDFLDRISTEGSVYKLGEELKRAYRSEPKNKNLHSFIENKLKAERVQTNRLFVPGKDELAPRIFRFLGLKSVSRNLKKTDRDVLSFFAILVGEWIFDVTIGNLFRLVAEKITSTAVWQKLAMRFEALSTHPVMQSLRAGWGVTGEFVRAAPSLNTLAGGYLGYTIAGPIGFPVGIGVGWGYQWALNLAKNPVLMERAVTYFDISAKLEKLNTLHWDLYKKFGAGSPEVEKISQDIERLETQRSSLAKVFGGPGPMLRFANWLNYGEWEIKSLGIKIPVGRLFRIPLKGFAVSSFVEQLRLAGMPLPDWYQGWMPPAAQYLWEIKGPLFDLIKNAFVQNVGIPAWRVFWFEGTSAIRVFDVTTFNENFVRWQLEQEGKGIVRIIRHPGLGQIDVEVRSFGRFARFFNSIFSKTGLIGQPLWNLRVGFRYLRYIVNTSPVGVWARNFFNPGVFLGIEVALAMGLPWWAIIPAGIVGSLAYTVGAGLIYKIFDFMGIGTGIGFESFLGRLSLGGYIGWTVGSIVEMVWGIPGAGWLGLAIGTGVSLLSMTGLGSFLFGGIASFAGGIITGVLGGLGIGIASAMELITVLAVGSVAVLAIFTIIIIGSAFWVPISENLKGLTATSPCFDISSPTFTDINGNNSNSIFTNGEEKTVCWTTKNKQEFYKDAVTETKSWYPANNFTVNNYKVTISTPDGKMLTWDKNSPNLQGGFSLNASSFLSSDQYFQSGGYRFNITPPKDTGGLYKTQMAQQINSIVTQIKNGDTADELMDQIAFAQIYSEVQRDYVLKPALSALQSMGGDSTKTKPLQDAINNLSYSPDEMQNRLTWCPTGACQFSRTCTFPGTDPVLLAKCKTYQDGVLKNYTPDLKTQLGNILNPIINGASPAQIQAQISMLQDQISAITDNGRNGARAQISLINEIKNSGMASKTGADLQTAIDNMATQFANNNPQNYFPADSTIQICLTLKYNGESGKTANIVEKDDAVLPILGPLSVPSCQAQLITPINASGPGNLLWPTDKRELSGGYDNNHKGVDIKGTPGKPVKAAASGTIIKQGTDPVSGGKSLGKYVVIQGDDGYYYLYGHLGDNVNGDSAAFSKNKGDRVNAGDNIGYQGNSGIVTGPHLHFGVSTTASGNGASDFYDNSTTTLNPCGFFAGGCP